MNLQVQILRLAVPMRQTSRCSPFAGSFMKFSGAVLLAEQWSSRRFHVRCPGPRVSTSADMDAERAGPDMGIWIPTWRHFPFFKPSQGAFRGNPPVSLVPSVSLLVGFPDSCGRRISRDSLSCANRRRPFGGRCHPSSSDGRNENLEEPLKTHNGGSLAAPSPWANPRHCSTLLSCQSLAES